MENQMKIYKTLVCLTIFATAIFTQGALAGDRAYPTNDLNLRAGPSVRFPAITVLRKDRPVIVHGCLRNYTWCDVSRGRFRGWASAAYLRTYTNDRQVAFPSVAEQLGIAILAFAIADYWDDYYHDYAFYSELALWESYDWLEEDYSSDWIDEAPPVWEGDDSPDWVDDGSPDWVEDGSTDDWAEELPAGDDLPFDEVDGWDDAEGADTDIGHVDGDAIVLD